MVIDDAQDGEVIVVDDLPTDGEQFVDGELVPFDGEMVLVED
jgi:hypothetical protein